jgi:hypothetical protein
VDAELLEKSFLNSYLTLAADPPSATQGLDVNAQLPGGLDDAYAFCNLPSPSRSLKDDPRLLVHLTPTP